MPKTFWSQASLNRAWRSMADSRNRRSNNSLTGKIASRLFKIRLEKTLKSFKSFSKSATSVKLTAKPTAKSKKNRQITIPKNKTIKSQRFSLKSRISRSNFWLRRMRLSNSKTNFKNWKTSLLEIFLSWKWEN